MSVTTRFWEFEDLPMFGGGVQKAVVQVFDPKPEAGTQASFATCLICKDTGYITVKGKHGSRFQQCICGRKKDG